MSEPTETNEPTADEVSAGGLAVAGAAKSDAETRPLRKSRVGVVVSDKMSKTRVVESVTRVPHPKFGKIIKQTKRYHVHDEEGASHVGDKVRIVETRPLSRTKRWRLVEVLAH